MMEMLTPEHFLPHVNKPVHVAGWHHPLTLTRVDMRRLEEWEREAAPRQPFTVIFRGPPGDVLAEGMCDLRFEDGTSCSLYMIPVFTPQQDRQNYQAVFN
jgi:hypothetical protein